MRVKTQIGYLLLTAACAPLVLYGCGPGFPLMTAEQEKMVQNVDLLLKDNEALKARVKALEFKEYSSVSQVQKNTAENAATLEKLNQAMTFVQGSIETMDHDNQQTKETIRAQGDKINALDGASRNDSARIEALKAAVDIHEKSINDLKIGLAALDKKETTPAPAEGAPDQTPVKKDAQSEQDAFYFKGYKEVIDKRYAAATETLQRFLAENPDHRFAGNAQYWLGEIYYANADWEHAILEFDKVTKKFPKSEKIPASLLKEGFAFEKLGSKKEAALLLEEVIEKFPKSPEAGLAKKKLDEIK